MTTQIVKASKADKKAFQFVKAATSKDDSRPVLQSILFNGGMVSADGWRLHYVDVNPTELEGMYIVPKVSDIMEVEAEECGTFPDVSQIVPKDDPTFEIAINPAFLAESCKHFDKDSAVVMRFRTNNSPVELFGKVDGIAAYALIMPLYFDKVEKEYIRPH